MAPVPVHCFSITFGLKYIQVSSFESNENIVAVHDYSVRIQSSVHQVIVS